MKRIFEKILFIVVSGYSFLNYKVANALSRPLEVQPLYGVEDPPNLIEYFFNPTTIMIITVILLVILLPVFVIIYVNKKINKSAKKSNKKS